MKIEFTLLDMRSSVIPQKLIPSWYLELADAAKAVQSFKGVIV